MFTFSLEHLHCRTRYVDLPTSIAPYPVLMIYGRFSLWENYLDKYLSHSWPAQMIVQHSHQWIGLENQRWEYWYSHWVYNHDTLGAPGPPKRFEWPLFSGEIKIKDCHIGDNGRYLCGSRPPFLDSACHDCIIDVVLILHEIAPVHVCRAHDQCAFLSPPEETFYTAHALEGTIQPPLIVLLYFCSRRLSWIFSMQYCSW